MSTKKTKKMPVDVQLWDFWGGRDLGKALRDAANFIDAMQATPGGDVVETVYCNEDDQGWSVSVLVKDIYRQKAATS